MNTAIIEIRLTYSYEQSASKSIVETIDRLNDIFAFTSSDLNMDILSISHVHHIDETRRCYFFSSTGVVLLNGQTLKSIVDYLQKDTSINAMVDGRKISIIILVNARR